MIDINELRRLAQSATPGNWQFWHGWVAADIDNDGGVIIVERPTPSGGKYQARVDNNFKFIAAADPQAILELLDRLEEAEQAADELGSLQRYRTAYNEWTDKTEWMQKSLPAKYLGMHRADVLKDMISGLFSRLEAAESARRDDYQNWLTALDRNAERCEDAMNECNELRAKIEAMERQEPVAFALYSGWSFKAAYHKEHEACDQRDRRQLSADLGGSLEAYRVVPLYALPGAQGEEK